MAIRVGYTILMLKNSDEFQINTKNITYLVISPGRIVLTWLIILSEVSRKVELVCIFLMKCSFSEQNDWRLTFLKVKCVPHIQKKRLRQHRFYYF